MKPVFFILLAFLATSCAYDPFARDTAIFSDYLQEYHHKTIGIEKHYYFIVTNNSCNACVRKFTAWMNDNIAPVKLSRITLITSVTDLIDPEIKKNFEMLPDSAGQINYLNLGLYNMSVLITCEGRITGRKQFQSNEEKLFQSFIDGL